MNIIRYRGGYKYQLHVDYEHTIPKHPATNIVLPFLTFEANGNLIIRKGYAWDGASGVPDFDSFMRASLVHDALYQLIRFEKIDRNEFKPVADRLMLNMCKEDGMFYPWALIMYFGVVLFGGRATRVKREVRTAPRTCFLNCCCFSDSLKALRKTFGWLFQ